MTRKKTIKTPTISDENILLILEYFFVELLPMSLSSWEKSNNDRHLLETKFSPVLLYVLLNNAKAGISQTKLLSLWEIFANKKAPMIRKLFKEYIKQGWPWTTSKFTEYTRNKDIFKPAQKEIRKNKDIYLPMTSKKLGTTTSYSWENRLTTIIKRAKNSNSETIFSFFKTIMFSISTTDTKEYHNFIPQLLFLIWLENILKKTTIKIFQKDFLNENAIWSCFESNAIESEIIKDYKPLINIEWIEKKILVKLRRIISPYWDDIQKKLIHNLINYNKNKIIDKFF